MKKNTLAHNFLSNPQAVQGPTKDNTSSSHWPISLNYRNEPEQMKPSDAELKKKKFPVFKHFEEGQFDGGRMLNFDWFKIKGTSEAQSLQSDCDTKASTVQSQALTEDQKLLASQTIPWPSPSTAHSLFKAPFRALSQSKTVRENEEKRHDQLQILGELRVGLATQKISELDSKIMEQYTSLAREVQKKDQKLQETLIKITKFKQRKEKIKQAQQEQKQALERANLKLAELYKTNQELLRIIERAERVEGGEGLDLEEGPFAYNGRVQKLCEEIQEASKTTRMLKSVARCLVEEETEELFRRFEEVKDHQKREDEIFYNK